MTKRIVTTYGRVRPDMGAGCPEKISLEFLHYIATFPRRQRPKVVAALQRSGVRAVWLRSADEQAAFVRMLSESGVAGAVATAAAWPQASGFSSTTM